MTTGPRSGPCGDSLGSNRPQRRELAVISNHRCFTILVALIILGISPPQTIQAELRFDAGIKGGVSSTRLTGDGTVERSRTFEDAATGQTITINQHLQNTKPGWVIGAYGAAYFAERWGIRLEGLYCRKGGKGKIYALVKDPTTGPFNYEGDETISINYLEFPLLGMYRAPAGETTTIELFLGPAMAFQTKAETTVDITSGLMAEPVTEDIGDQIKSTDIGIVLGADVKFDLPKTRVVIDARWTRGLSSIDDSDENLDIKNSAITVTVGLGYGLVR